MEERTNEGSKCTYGPRCKCCVCMTVKALLLLVIGAVIGYIVGKR